MGSLILPPSGSIYVDANSVIYAVEKIEPYLSFLAPLWPVAQAGQVSIVTGDLTWLETLVKPMRDGNAALELLFRAFLTARSSPNPSHFARVGTGRASERAGAEDA